jgi:hypothetical protein
MFVNAIFLFLTAKETRPREVKANKKTKKQNNKKVKK